MFHMGGGVKFLMQNIPSSWLEGQTLDYLGVFDRFVDNIVSIQKVIKFTYSTLLEDVYLISEFVFDKVFQKTLKIWTGKIFICVILNVVLILVFYPFISRSSIMHLLSITSCLNLKGRSLQIVCFFVKSEHFPKTITHFFCDCILLRGYCTPARKLACFANFLLHREEN